MNRLASTGEITSPTQWITRVHVTLCVVGVVGLVAVAGALPDGDAMPDGDLVGADDDVLDEQAQDTLALGHLSVVGVAAELGEEAVQVVGKPEVGVAVGELGVQRVELATQIALAGAQVGQPAPELVDGDELFLECLDHAGDRGGGLGQGQFQAGALAGGRIGCAGPFQPLVDLGPDQVWVGEQATDVVPDDGVEQVGTNRLVGADAPTLIPVVVGTKAPVVVDLVARGAGRGAVVAVAAAGAGGQALEQRWDLAVAGGEPLVVLKALRGTLERLVADDRGDGDGDPLLAGTVHRLDGARGGAALQAGPAV